MHTTRIERFIRCAIRLPYSQHRLEAETIQTHSAGGFLKYHSMAPEKAANAAPPPNAATTPELLAKVAPAQKPPARPFQ